MSVNIKKVLVIDDEEEIVNAAKRMLERSGFEVNTALNGKQGMDLVIQSRPDVIITDIIMPIMDGYEFFKKIRMESSTSKIPVIILTARQNMEDSFRALGVQGFVTKPFNSESLVRKIQQITTPEAERPTKGKVLLAGSDEYTLNHMAILLKDDGYKALVVDDVFELISLALQEIPNYIFLDVFTRKVPTRELIRALHCFHKLDNTKILLYTNFSPDKTGSFENVDYLQEAKDSCMAAGASHYIGRFSSVNFVDSVNSMRTNE